MLCARRCGRRPMLRPHNTSIRSLNRVFVASREPRVQATTSLRLPQADKPHLAPQRGVVGPILVVNGGPLIPVCFLAAIKCVAGHRLALPFISGVSDGFICMGRKDRLYPGPPNVSRDPDTGHINKNL